MLTYETEAMNNGYRQVAGVDEAGRGPLAGPVVAAAVILPAGLMIEGLTDSKQLSRAKREELYEIIHKKAVSVGYQSIGPDVIDSINILQATKLAMTKAIGKLSPSPDFALVDGNQPVEWPGGQRTIVKGDCLSLSIAAASVVAKVTRDRLMEEYGRIYPEYGFEKHKGYGAAVHRNAIKQFGPCPIHRKTFKGVREYLSPEEKILIGDRQLDLIESYEVQNRTG